MDVMMTLSMTHLAPTLLTLFMLALAVGPLALAWQDSRRRAQVAERLRALKREARVSATLRTRRPDRVAAPQWDRVARG
jgi:nicotinamide riboside transporter PnuC